MYSLIIFAIFAMAAHLFQVWLGWQQLKDFNKTYTILRKLGRVAIGRKPGKIKSGTIVMFAVDENGRVLKASKMQGVTILAGFQNMENFVGEDIHYFDKYNPLVRQENKLLQEAIQDARKVYLCHEAGIEQETNSSNSFLGLGFYANYLKLSIKQFFTKNKKRSSL